MNGSGEPDKGRQGEDMMVNQGKPPGEEPESERIRGRRKGVRGASGFLISREEEPLEKLPRTNVC